MLESDTSPTLLINKDSLTQTLSKCGLTASSLLSFPSFLKLFLYYLHVNPKLAVLSITINLCSAL